MNLKHQPDQFLTYKGHELMARNIFWTQHLEQAWQCNWLKNIYYAPTAEAVFEKVKQHIDAFSALILNERIQ